MMDVEKALFVQGQTDALALQKAAPEMDGTQLYAKTEMIPNFQDTLKVKNINERTAGFVCRSTAGRVVRLVQPYDSSIFTNEPEELSAQWGFVWSKEPKDALPFVALSTSPYGTGDCCTENSNIYRSKSEGNVFSPHEYPQGWDKITETGEIIPE